MSHLSVGPGTRVGPFRVEHLIASGSAGAVYGATQVSLRRAVALRLIESRHFKSPAELVRFDRRQRLAASVHHPNLVPYYEAGDWEGGRFIATRLIHGKSLADLRSDRALPPAGALQPLAGALRAAHAAGLFHGRISDQNILVEKDGTPYLADLGLSGEGSPEADDEALAAVIARLPAKAQSAGSRKNAWRVAAASACVAAAAVVIALTSDGGTQSAPLAEAPASPRGTTAIGSPLGPEATRPLGCSDLPSANTPACTIAQTIRDGKPLRVQRAGVIREWAVRGASGDLALQVIRERDGKSFVAAFSQPVRLGDSAPRVFAADIAVRPGDLLGLRLAPGATVGTISSTGGAAMARWDGGLTADSAAPDGMTLDGELMLRADIEFGAHPSSGDQILGRQAATAPRGRILDDTPVTLIGGKPATAIVVELGDGIAVDVVSGTRLARLEIPDADPEGELLGIEQSCGGAGASGFCLRWQNPLDELALFHTFRVRQSGRIKLIG